MILAELIVPAFGLFYSRRRAAPQGTFLNARPGRRRAAISSRLVTAGSDADFRVVHIDDCVSVPAYEAELVFLRHALGVGSFGMQVERLPAHYEAYAEHDEQDSGQEEIYTVLDGSARLLVSGEEHRLRPGVFARVGPAITRKIVTDDEPALLLCLGGVRGEPYEPPSWTVPNQRSS
jgi:quercetin dioxygenase-like cupin family protein